MRKTLILVLLIGLPSPVEAEVVRLKSGAVLEGRIVEETKQSLAIDVGAGINVSFTKAQIASVEPSAVPVTAKTAASGDLALRSSPFVLPDAGSDKTSSAQSAVLPPEPKKIQPQVVPLLRWMKRHVNPDTQLPFSFFVPADAKKKIYTQMGKADTIPGIIERSIVAEGLEVYDGALWQIVLTSLGEPEDIQLASKPVELYWEGRLGNLVHIRAGFPGQPYIYDPGRIDAVSADIDRKGERGFVFRIINAKGNYNMKDPLDGKATAEGFPTWSTIHWEDWKPIAGENAWITMAALHLFHRKYYDRQQEKYVPTEKARELFLAEELARAAIILQADNGGIRMAPLGTYYNSFIDENGTSFDTVDPQSKRLEKYMRQTERLRKKPRTRTETWEDISKRFPPEYIWYYDEISTENNLSWYAAFRMLFQVTKKEEYRTAMTRISRYLVAAWNKEKNSFYQGMHYKKGEWLPNDDHFATDVQTWSIAVVGPEQLDEWLGEGTAMRIWQQTKKTAGYFIEPGTLGGVGFTSEHDRLSVEWTGGAILATQALAAYYEESHPDWAKEAMQDSTTMRRGIEYFRDEVGQGEAAYSYSSRRGWIPFGWFSHIPEVMSLASTSWVVLIDQKINPFILPEQ